MALEGEGAEVARDGGNREGTVMAQELAMTAAGMAGGLKERVSAYERRLIQEALWLSGGNQRRAAAALGCLPTTLNEKMRRLGLRSQDALSAPGVAPNQPVAPPPIEAVPHTS